MSDEKQLILLCAAVILIGALTITAKVAPILYEESKLPITNSNW